MHLKHLKSVVLKWQISVVLATCGRRNSALERSVIRIVTRLRTGRFGVRISTWVYCVRNVVAHGDAREEKWRGNWRMEWVASTLTRPRNVVYPALLTLMRTPRLQAVDWTDSPADLNGLVRLGERRNVVFARVPSGSARTLRDSSPVHMNRPRRLWGLPGVLFNGYWFLLLG
jgi:hypothetical protein